MAKNTKLYIIGNGFDLHHHLQTSYSNFANYLKTHNTDLYNTLEEYIFYPSSDNNLWSNFEANLANLDAKQILSDNADRLPDYASDDFRDRDRYVFPDLMDQYHDQLTNTLFSEFHEFILNVAFPQSVTDYKLSIDRQAKFLTFNYTNTLERIYGIDKNNILYIHNSAFASDNIILGHGIDPVNFEETQPEPPDDLTGEDLERWHDSHDSYDYSYDSGKQSIMRYFADTFKPTEHIIKEHQHFFADLASIEEVYVLGHSISDVDLPYFITICKTVPSLKIWHVSYYNEEEMQRHLATPTNIGIDAHNIIQFQLTEIQEGNRQLQLEF